MDKTKTFHDLYKEACSKPTPRQAFIQEVARLTLRSESAVELWAAGATKPNKEIQRLIAGHFGLDEPF